jgi:hypothetical protein
VLDRQLRHSLRKLRIQSAHVIVLDRKVGSYKRHITD